MSSGSSGRGSQMTEGERSQSRLNESISRFSPRMSSTKRGHSISEAGAADAGEKEPSQLRSQSLSDTAANGKENISFSFSSQGLHAFVII